MIYYLLFAGILLEYGALAAKMFRCRGLARMIVYTAGILISFYSMAAVCLMYLDRFSVSKALAACFAAGLILLLLLHTNKTETIYAEREGMLYLLVFFVFAMPLVAAKGETMRLGSDVGYYTEKAVDLMFTDTDSIKVLGEYVNAPSGMKTGLDRLQALTYFDKIPGEKELYLYTFHGLSAWPALMALFGKLFGVENMFLSLTLVFFLAGLAMCLFISSNGKNPAASLVVLPFFLMAPIMIYLAKLSFSEMEFIALLSIGGLMLTDGEGESTWTVFIAGVIFASLVVVHISTFMYIPALYTVLMILGTLKERRLYFRSAAFMLLLFLLLLHINYKISYIYVRDILCAQFPFFSGADSIMKAFSIFFVSLAVFTIFFEKLLIRKPAIRKELTAFFADRFSFVLRICMGIILLYTVFQAYRLGFTDRFSAGGGSWAMRSAYGGKGLSALIHLNFTSFLMGLSFIGLPCIIWNLFRKQELTDTEKLLYFLFEFVMLIYTVIRCDTPSNYYASRYYALFMYPVGILILGMALSKIRWIIVLCLVALGCNLPFDMTMKDYKAFMGTNAVLEGAMQTIPSNASVFLEPDRNLADILLFNLKEINGNKVYNLENYEEGIRFLQPKELYIVSSSPLPELGETLLLYGKYRSTRDIADFSSVNTIGLFPLKLQESKSEYYIYRNIPKGDAR